MTTATAFRGMSAVKLLAALAIVVVGVALLTPEEPGKSEGGRSSYSTGPGGVGMMFELAKRTGWRVERRLTPMDSVLRDTTVQVVIDPSVTLGVREVHRLLENVRSGGGLIFTIDAEEIAESLGVARGSPGRFSRAIEIRIVRIRRRFASARCSRFRRRCTVCSGKNLPAE